MRTNIVIDYKLVRDARAATGLKQAGSVEEGILIQDTKTLEKINPGFTAEHPKLGAQHFSMVTVIEFSRYCILLASCSEA